MPPSHDSFGALCAVPAPQQMLLPHGACGGWAPEVPATAMRYPTRTSTAVPYVPAAHKAQQQHAQAKGKKGKTGKQKAQQQQQHAAGGFASVVPTPQTQSPAVQPLVGGAPAAPVEPAHGVPLHAPEQSFGDIPYDFGVDDAARPGVGGLASTLHRALHQRRAALERDLREVCKTRQRILDDIAQVNRSIAQIGTLTLASAVATSPAATSAAMLAALSQANLAAAAAASAPLADVDALHAQTSAALSSATEAAAESSAASGALQHHNQLLKTAAAGCDATATAAAWNGYDLAPLAQVEQLLWDVAGTGAMAGERGPDARGGGDAASSLSGSDQAVSDEALVASRGTSVAGTLDNESTDKLWVKWQQTQAARPAPSPAKATALADAAVDLFKQKWGARYAERAGTNSNTTALTARDAKAAVYALLDDNGNPFYVSQCGGVVSQRVAELWAETPLEQALRARRAADAGPPAVVTLQAGLADAQARQDAEAAWVAWAQALPEVTLVNPHQGALASNPESVRLFYARWGGYYMRALKKRTKQADPVPPAETAKGVVFALLDDEGDPVYIGYSRGTAQKGLEELWFQSASTDERGAPKYVSNFHEYLRKRARDGQGLHPCVLEEMRADGNRKTARGAWIAWAQELPMASPKLFHRSLKAHSKPLRDGARGAASPSVCVDWNTTTAIDNSAVVATPTGSMATGRPLSQGSF